MRGAGTAGTGVGFRPPGGPAAALSGWFRAMDRLGDRNNQCPQAITVRVKGSKSIVAGPGAETVPGGNTPPESRVTPMAWGQLLV